jgi:hypothetical protein
MLFLQQTSTCLLTFNCETDARELTTQNSHRTQRAPSNMPQYPLYTGWRRVSGIGNGQICGGGGCYDYSSPTAAYSHARGISDDTIDPGQPPCMADSHAMLQLTSDSTPQNSVREVVPVGSGDCARYRSEEVGGGKHCVWEVKGNSAMSRFLRYEDGAVYVRAS